MDLWLIETSSRSWNNDLHVGEIRLVSFTFIRVYREIEKDRRRKSFEDVSPGLFFLLLG